MTLHDRVKARREWILEYIKGVKYATVSQVWDDLPTEEKAISANSLRSYMNTMVQQELLKTRKIKDRILLYYLPDTEPPTPKDHPRVVRDFTEGAFSRSARLQNHYYSTRY